MAGTRHWLGGTLEISVYSSANCGSGDISSRVHSRSYANSKSHSHHLSSYSYIRANGNILCNRHTVDLHST